MPGRVRARGKDCILQLFSQEIKNKLAFFSKKTVHKVSVRHVSAKAEICRTDNPCNRRVVCCGLLQIFGMCDVSEGQPAAPSKKRTWDEDSVQSGSYTLPCTEDEDDHEEEIEAFYDGFLSGLKELKPHFVTGMEHLTLAFKMLRELLVEMVACYARLYSNDSIPEELCRHWRDLCEEHLLGPHPGHNQPDRIMIMEVRKSSIIQIRKKVCYQVNKYNEKISGHTIGKNKKAKQSSFPSVVSPVVIASTPLPDEEEDVEEEGKISEIEKSSSSVVSSVVIGNGWEDEGPVETDEYAEKPSEGKKSSTMSDSSIRSPQSPISEIERTPSLSQSSSSLVVSPVVIASSPLPPQSASEMQLSEGDDDEKEEGKDVSPSPSTEEVVESMVSLFFSADGEKGDTTSVRIEFGDGYLEGQSEEEVGEGKILLPMHALLINLSLPSPISGGGGRGGGEGIEEEGEDSSPGPQRKIQVISPSSTTKEVAATIPGLRRRLIRTASNSSDQAFFSPTAPKTPNPSAKVTPKKVRKAPKKKRGSSSAKLVDHSVDNFSFSFLQIKEAIEHFIKFGFVKLHPNQAFKYHATDLVQRLVDEAKALDTTLDEMLRIHVDEPMSTALGDKLRSMKHEKTYPIGEDPHTKFFDIMRELNLHFVSGNQSALRMLTSNLQEADKPLKVFHHPTEVLDIITKPKGKSQNAHIDAFLDEVQ